MRLLRTIRIALALLALAAIAMPLAHAEPLEVEVFDDQGRYDSSLTLYRDRQTLILTSKSPVSRDAEREALDAWFTSLGHKVTTFDAGDGNPAPLLERATNWVQVIDTEEAALVVIVDGRINDRHELVDAGSAFPMAPLMEKLIDARAKHVLVVFTGVFNRPNWPGSKVSSLPPRDKRWLRRTVGNKTRRALVPRPRGGERTIPFLINVLSQSPILDQSPFFDPDGYTTATDIADRAGFLDLWRLGDRFDDEGGEIVLAPRITVETPFGRSQFGTAREHPREAYTAVRFSQSEDSLRALIAEQGQNRWTEAAEQQLRLLERRNRQVSARLCDEQVSFATEELMALETGVVAELRPFGQVVDLAEQWLGAMRAASGLSEAQFAAVAAECLAAGPPLPERPDRALRLALLDREAGFATDIASQGREPEPTRDAATVLAALKLLARHPGAGAPEPILTALRDAAERGHAPAQLLQALVLFDGSYGAISNERAAEHLLAAANAGLPLAQALYGAIMLSAEPPLSEWRRGLAVDEERARVMVERASLQSFAIDDALFDRGKIERAQIAACEAGLKRVDAAVLMDAARYVSLDAPVALFSEPAAALRASFGAALPNSPPSECAKMPAAETLPARLRLDHERVSVKLAMVEIAARDFPAAEARLSALEEASGPANFLLAALRGLRDPKAMATHLERAASLGVGAAPMIRAGYALQSADPAARERGLTALRTLAAKPSAAARAYLAMQLLNQIDTLEPEKNGAQIDRLIAEAFFWLMEARSAQPEFDFPEVRVQGRTVPLPERVYGLIQARVPAMMGLRFAELSGQHRQLLGIARPGGVMVHPLNQAPAGVGVGDVVMAIAGTPVANVAAAEGQLLRAVFAAWAGRGQIALDIVAFEDGRQLVETIPLPPAFAGLPVPTALSGR